MTLEKREFSSRYTALMLEYAQSFEEAPLLAIEELGHEMVQSNMPPEDIGEMHDHAIGKLMATPEISPERIRAASMPLMQLLMAYGIVFREVRARHEIEQALIKSEALHREIMHSAFDAIIISDCTGVILEANRAAADVFGYPPEAWQGLEITALIPGHLRQKHEHGFRNFIESGERNIIGQCVEIEALHRDGHIFPIELALSELNHGQAKLMATIRDITGRKQAQDALHSLATTFSAVSGEAFFSNVVMHLATTLGMDYAMIGELMGERDRVNVVGGYAKGQAMELPFQYDLAGTPCEHVIGQSFCICHSGVQQKYPKDALLAELGVEGYIGSPLFDSAGNPLGIMLLMHGEKIKNPEVAETIFKIFSARVSAEIERSQAESSLRKLSSAIEQAGESVVITNREGIIEYVNPAFTRITGYSSEEAIGQTPRLLKSGNQDAAFYESMWKTITDGKVWHGKVIDRRKDGSFYPAMLTISPVLDHGGEITNYTHFIGIQSDLSQLEDMEQRFHQAQKMEAIGTMVGGIAHNFNNMLAGMTGNLYLAKKRVGENPDVIQKLAHVEELSLHAADMIQQLLAFARKGMVSMKEMPLTPFINETLKLLRASVPENIAMHQDICSGDLQIKGDATQLHQVLANLINNARDAVEDMDEPRITIRLAAFAADDAFIESHPYFVTGAYAHLSLADNGVGIPEHQLEHLFEPFFTTKEQGKGTGLGLSMVYGAVKTHEGFVEVDSVKGAGSTFHIYIPLLELESIAADSMPETELAEGRGELILLADDEQMVREVMAEVLESFGYTVLLAEDGLKAIELFRAHEQNIALALLDVVMPHLGGMDLAGRIREIKPDMPIIFLTGYDQEHVLNGDEALPNSETLTKPVDFDLLSHSIRQMLDCKPRSC